MSQVCALCAGVIEKRCLLIGDKLFHVDCASCFTCGAAVSNLNTCFMRNNHLYCRPDFCRLFCTTDHICTKNVCPVCQLSVRPGDVIQCVGERKYHFVCFRCSVCHQSILTGDSYRAEPNGLLVCFKVCFISPYDFNLQKANFSISLSRHRLQRVKRKQKMRGATQMTIHRGLHIRIRYFIGILELF